MLVSSCGRGIPTGLLFVSLASPSLISRTPRRALGRAAFPIHFEDQPLHSRGQRFVGWESSPRLYGGGIRQASGVSDTIGADSGGGSPLMSGFSIEMTEQASKEVESFAKILPAGTAVFIANLQSTRVEDVVDLCRRLKADGMTPVPHMTARGIKNAAELDKILSEFAGAGVQRVLLISGDYPTAVGEFKAVIDLLKTGLFKKHSIQQIDIAGHPEGCAAISNTTHALVEKTQWAKENGVRMDIITQVCFDAGVVSEWCRQLRTAGITNRVKVGVAGPAKISTLVKFAGMIGVGPSAAMLMSQPGLIAQVASQMNDPAKFTATLSHNINSSPSTHGSIGVHMYSFGGFQRTAQWACGRASMAQGVCDP